MSRYAIKEGIVVAKAQDNLRLIFDETGRRRFDSPLVAALLDQIVGGNGDEDKLLEATSRNYSAAEIFYALLQLTKQRILVEADRQPEPPAILFDEKLAGRRSHQADLSAKWAVRVVAIGGMETAAAAIAMSLTRINRLQVSQLADWRQATLEKEAVFVVITADYLEPELSEFGRFAQTEGLRWMPAKPYGVIPWLGPLFLPEQTACLACLLDRVRGHRNEEVAEIDKAGGTASLRLSQGYTEHSMEVVSGFLAVELGKLAEGQPSELAGTLISLDFRTLKLERHRLTRRPQCPVCGQAVRERRTLQEMLSQPPLRLQSRRKADYRDGGERVCSAAETLEKYEHLVSPITGVVGKMAAREGSPAGFGPVMVSDWIVRTKLEWLERNNSRMSPIGISAGKGRTAMQARVSALGESIERYCSQHEGYEPCYRGSYEDLRDIAIHPNAIMGYSEVQYRDRAIWRDKCATSFVPDPFDPARPIDWTPAWSLSQERWRLVPSALAYYAYPTEGGGDVCFGCSNGVAAGNCLEEAILQGLCELVERDATAMWWYHKLRKPAVDWRSFDSSFAATVVHTVNELGFSLEILDLTHDLGIPVFSANLMDRENRFKSHGLGCHQDPRIALERAVSEVGQMWQGLHDIDALSCKIQQAPISQEKFLRADPAQTKRTYADFPVVRRADFAEDIQAIIRLLQGRGLELMVLDLTRPDVGLSVARVIVPGMVHFWPRFGCRRLYDVPKAAGWIAEDIGEESLNPVPIPW